jgi:hypothetical protein
METHQLIRDTLSIANDRNKGRAFSTTADLEFPPSSQGKILAEP